MKLIATSYKYPDLPYQFPCRTLEAEGVVCVEWDEDSECWLTADGKRVQPDHLMIATPPTDESDGYYALDVPLQAISDDGKQIRVVGFVACDGCWETDTGSREEFVNCPVPEIRRKFRSLDAPWYS